MVCHCDFIKNRNAIFFMKLFIEDTTVSPAIIKYFTDIKAVIKYLEDMIFRKFHQTRQEFMDYMAELGYSYNGNADPAFIWACREYFKMGIIREGKKVYCDIGHINEFNKNEYGD